MRWCLVLEEYGPEPEYIKGKRNVVADALSRLDIEDDRKIFNVSECFGFDNDDLHESAFPVCYRDIAKAQKATPALQLKLASHKDYDETTFRGGDTMHMLICRKDKIALPPSLQQKTIDWYQQGETLCQPGETRTEQTLRQHFDWKGLRTMVHATCKKCSTCQKAKLTTIKYGILPAKEAESNPWDTVCVDLIGPYKIRRKEKKYLKLWCLTMIDPVTVEIQYLAPLSSAIALL
jgi:hypothetical protein